ncbi:hypothetical protein [Streptomyces mesophilus]|uniref:hypothetical protein n=1 Tax=Streptomyces mesophilus TaxID=1775132 RepID=UPI003326B25D
MKEQSGTPRSSGEAPAPAKWSPSERWQVRVGVAGVLVALAAGSVQFVQGLDEPSTRLGYLIVEPQGDQGARWCEGKGKGKKTVALPGVRALKGTSGR